MEHRGSAPGPPAQLLDSGLSELGLDPPEAVREGLLALADLLASWSLRINLTAHRTPQAIVKRLILDAAALSRVLPDVPGLVDLGSGAGFPGLPLGLLRPHLRVLLVEARERRHHFQRAALRQLGMANVEALRGRAELLAPRPAPLVIAQALAAPDRALALARPWLAPGGWVAIPGSAQRVGPRQPPDWIVEVGDVAYQVPAGGPDRRLWLGRCEPAPRPVEAGA